MTYTLKYDDVFKGSQKVLITLFHIVLNRHDKINHMFVSFFSALVDLNVMALIVSHCHGNSSNLNSCLTCTVTNKMSPTTECRADWTDNHRQITCSCHFLQFSWLILVFFFFHSFCRCGQRRAPDSDCSC